MTRGAAILLFGLGIGAAIVGAGRADSTASPRQRADALRAQTSRAQETSAAAARRARDLMDQWIAAEDAARKAGQ